MFNLFTGCAYENTKQYDSAAYFLEAAASISRKIKIVSFEMLALSRLNYVYSNTRDNEKVNTTVQRMKQIGDTSQQITIKEMAASALAGYYVDRHEYAKAIEYREKFIELYKIALKEDSLTKDPINLAYAQMNLANLFNTLGQHEKALEYLNDARPHLQGRVFKGNEESFYLFLVQTFIGLQQPDSALFYYKLSYNAMQGKGYIIQYTQHTEQCFGQLLSGA